MSVVELLHELGGVATRGRLVALTSRAAVDRALEAGDLVAHARGRYALPVADEAVRAAHRLAGVVCLESAALHWGWEVKEVPPRPHVVVAKGRSIDETARRGVHLHRTDLGPDDVDGLATSRSRTLVDCSRSLSFGAALAVADSALRGGFPPADLLALARDARGPGARQVRRVASVADGRAANPFESVLRSVAVTVPGLAVRPQVAIREPRFLGRPDLVDERLRIILEADSFAWHGDRRALARDARRYNQFVVHGWLVLRFTWEDVMHEPDRVATVLAAAVGERTEAPGRGRRSA